MFLHTTSPNLAHVTTKAKALAHPQDMPCQPQYEDSGSDRKSSETLSLKGWNRGDDDPSWKEREQRNSSDEYENSPSLTVSQAM